MHADIRERWARACESGLAQTTGKLGRVNPETGEESFCCLGVLSEVAVEDGVVSRHVEETKHCKTCELEHSPDVYYGNASTLLPDEVVEWAGLNAVSPEIELPIGWIRENALDEAATDLLDGEDDDLLVVPFADLNDEYRVPLNKIGEAIRTYRVV